MQTSTKCYILVAGVVVAGCVYGGLYWWACEHPLSDFAERMLSPEKRAEKLTASVVPDHITTTWFSSSEDGTTVRLVLTAEGARVFGTLRDIGAPAVPALLECLGDADSGIRIKAVLMLMDIGDTSAVPALVEHLCDEYWGVRRAAAEALDRIAGASAVPAIIECLGDEDEDVREVVAWVLGRIGDASAVPTLIECLSAGSYSVSREAAEALGRIGHASALPALERLRRDLDLGLWADEGYQPSVDVDKAMTRLHRRAPSAN